MRVLFTTFTYAPEVNGVANVVIEQAEGLARRGHQVTVATTVNSSRRKGLSNQDNPHVVQFDVSGNARIGFTGQVGEYLRYLSEWNGDAVISHGWNHWSTDVAFEVLKRHPARKVMVSHGFGVHRYPKGCVFPRGFRTWLGWRPYVRELPRNLRCFDHLVFLSHSENRDRFYDHWILNRYGGPESTIIPNGVHLSEFDVDNLEFRRRHGLVGRLLVLNVGIYAPSKDQELALRTFVDARLEDATLVFIGNEMNDYARHVQAVQQKIAAQVDVRFLDRLSRRETIEAFVGADIFLMTSPAETQPLVLLEAMACGLPFVSTHVGCISDFPGGVVARTRRDLVGRLRELAANLTRRAELGCRGREAVRSAYSWKVVVDRYEQLLKRLIDENRTATIKPQG